MNQCNNGWLNLRFHEQSCEKCRYFRIHTTGASTSECLLLGRSLGISGKGEYALLFGWARERICDGWKRRPKTWNIYSTGVENSPYWKDAYVSRVTQKRLRKKYKIT